MRAMPYIKRFLIAVFCSISIFLCTDAACSAASNKSRGDTLRVGVPTDRCPIAYIDHETGEIVGIGVELLREVAGNAGYKTEFVEIKEGNLKEALDNDEYDLLMPFGSAIKSASGKSIVVSDCLMQTPLTLVTLKNKKLPPLNSLKVGMLSSQAGIAETVEALYPGMQISLYEDVSESVSALKSRHVDALLHNSYVWSYVLQKPTYSDLVLQSQAIISTDFRAGAVDTQKSRDIMERLDKGIAQTPDTYRQAVILDYTNRRLYVYSLFDYLYQNILLIIVFLAVLCVGLYDARRVRKAYKVAEEASKAKSMFLANMSHEIRTPINAIMGMGELISRDSTDPKARQYAHSISSSANSLLCLVNDILDFSRMEAGKLKLIDHEYHLSNVLTDINVMIRERATSKGLNYNVVVNRDTPDLLIGDETRLKQVMINLLTNGVKYTMAGFVILNIDFEQIGENAIELRVSVKDTGIGMKQEEINKLFNAFERLDEARNRTIEGTGLGMSIVKQILDAMDSKLDVKSVYGAGSEFSFAIRQKVSDWTPIGDYESTSAKVAEGQSGYVPGFYAPDARILIVDDTEINIRVACGLLEHTGLQIDTATGGKEALGMTLKTKYDVLLIDHRMPGMDGVELLKHIRFDENNLNRESVCVALTANVVDGAKDMYIHAGFDDYLEKPISGKRLERALEKYLPAEKLSRPEKSVFAGASDAGNNADNASGIAGTDSGPGSMTAGNESVATHAEGAPSLSERLNKLQDDGYINIQDGIDFAGTEDLFVDTLAFFRDSVEKKADEIEELYKSGNIEDYTVKVHALKSSAKIIGAYTLSDKAKSLEDAGKRSDLEFIEQNNGALLEAYRSYRQLLAGISRG